MKEAIPPIIDPTVGTQCTGSTSTSMNILINSAADSFRGLIPSMLGYLEATPFLSAIISASTPTKVGSRPGTPISILMNSSPEILSISLTIFTSSRMVDFPAGWIPKASITSLTSSEFMGVESIICDFEIHREIRQWKTKPLCPRAYLRCVIKLFSLSGYGHLLPPDYSLSPELDSGPSQQSQ